MILIFEDLLRIYCLDFLPIVLKSDPIVLE